MSFGWFRGGIPLAGVLLAAALLAFGHAQAAGKVSVVMSVEVAAAPAEVWRMVGAFDKLQGWHPAVEDTRMEGSATQVGSMRVLMLKGGGEIREQLTSYSDSGMRLNYSILESPLPVANYESFLALTEAGNGGTLVIWGSTFDPAGGATAAKAKEVISGIYQAGFDTLAKKLGK